MNELRLTRGRDIMIAANGERLFGVIRFSASEKTNYHSVQEYLSTDPCARLPLGSLHTIRLRVLSLFEGQISTQDSFTLCVRDEDEEYVYENCRVAESSCSAQGDQHAYREYIIEANQLIRREVEDDE